MIPTSEHNKITVYKNNNILYDGDVTSDIEINRQPPSTGSFLKFLVGNLNNNTISFVINGTETLTFNKNGYKLTSNSYTAITSITATGFDHETIQIFSVDIAGNPIYYQTEEYYDCIINFLSMQSAYMTSLLASGLLSKNSIEVTIDGDVDISTGETFSIEKQDGIYIVWQNPIKIFQLGTDLVTHTKFIGDLIPYPGG